MKREEKKQVKGLRVDKPESSKSRRTPNFRNVQGEENIKGGEPYWTALRTSKRFGRKEALSAQR